MLWAVAVPLPAQEEARAWRVDSGDVLDIQVPKYPEFSKLYPVSRDGTITMDLVGAFPVRGLTPPEIEQRLGARLREYLRFVEAVNVKVSARRMLIRVVGAVGDPGQKDVHKEANVQEAIAAAGGPQVGALVTRIVIRRRVGDWVEEIPVDLKAYLEGRGRLPELRNGDEIFVPRVEVEGGVQRPLGPQDVQEPGAPGKVRVLGAVKNPGEFAVREDSTVLSLLSAAGGWLDTADLTRIRRLPGGTGRAELFDLQGYLDRGGAVPRVFAGDVVSVPSRTVATRMVRVIGAVTTPGPVNLTPDADLQSAITSAGGLLPVADTRHVRLVRSEGGETVTRELDLEAYLRGGDPTGIPELRNGDVIFVPKGTMPLPTTNATVYVFGAVTRPGPYPLVEQRALLHVLASAGGTLPYANLSRLKISRAAADGPRIVYFDLQGYQDGEVGQLPPLADGDTITVDHNTVVVVGEVAKPGEVTIRTRGTVVDALAGAGGPTVNADLSQVVITRNGPEGATRQVVNLEVYLTSATTAPPPPPLRAGDVVAVETGATDRQSVFVLGAVMRPGPVPLPGRRASVLYALATAGGVAPNADRAQVRIIHPGPGGLRTDIFDYKALLAGELTVANATPPEVRPGDIVAVDEVGKLGTGVLVLGAVAKQGRVPIERKGQTVIDTIGLVGGLLPNANPGRVRLVRAGGEVTTLDLSTFSQKGVPTPEVRDGDVLVIGYKKDARDIWDELLRIFPFFAFFIR